MSSSVMLFFLNCIHITFVVLGDNSFSVINRIHPAGAGMLEIHDHATATEVEILVSTEKPLLTEEQLKTW